LRAEKQRLRSAVGLALFTFGMLAAAIIFVEVQLLNVVYHLGGSVIQAQGYPWWGERMTFQSCFVDPGPGPNCGFINYAQGLVIALAVSIVGFMVWQGSRPGSRSTGGLPLNAIGSALLVFGVLISSLVFVEVQALNGVYHYGQYAVYFQGFPLGGQEVLGSACILGADIYHCAFFNYDQLMFAAAAAAFIGFVLWDYTK